MVEFTRKFGLQILRRRPHAKPKTVEGYIKVNLLGTDRLNGKWKEICSSDRLRIKTKVSSEWWTINCQKCDSLVKNNWILLAITHVMYTYAVNSRPWRSRSLRHFLKLDSGTYFEIVETISPITQYFADRSVHFKNIFRLPLFPSRALSSWIIWSKLERICFPHTYCLSHQPLVVTDLITI
jgi:hypothetical protein